MNLVRKALLKRNKSHPSDSAKRRDNNENGTSTPVKKTHARVEQYAKESSHSDHKAPVKRWNVRRRYSGPDSPTTNSGSTVAERSPLRSNGSGETYVTEEQDPLIRNALEFEHGQSLSVDQCNKVTAAVAALDKSGTDLYAQGDYKQAFLRFEKALALKRRSLVDHSLAWRKYEDIEQRKKSTNRSVGSDETTVLSDQSTPLKNTLNSLSILKSHPTYLATQKVNSTISSSNKDDEYSRNLVASVATSINNLTFLKQQNGQSSNEETLASYMQCLQMKLEVLGPHHLSVGKTLNNIGSVFYVQGNYAASLQAYLDAHNIMQAELGQDHLDVATVASNIGDAYRCVGDSDEKALFYYRLALDIRWKLLPHNHPKIARLMEQTASLELKQGDEALLSPRRQQDSDSVESEGEADEDSKGKAAEEDMRFIEELERKATKGFVADKETFIREFSELVREQQKSSDDKQSKKATSLSVDDVDPKNQSSNQVDFRRKRQLGSSSPDSEIVEEHTIDAGDLPVQARNKPMRFNEHAEFAFGTEKNHPHASKTSRTKLSVDERRRALIAVKERLARIRASRTHTRSDIVGENGRAIRKSSESIRQPVNGPCSKFG
jgi:tetratricopeptide (TPR) repeat protein